VKLSPPLLAIAALCLAGSVAGQTSGLKFNATGPDAASFGAAQHFSVGDRVT